MSLNQSVESSTKARGMCDQLAVFCFPKYRKQLTWLLSFLIALFHWKCFLFSLILIVGGSPGWVKLPFNRVTHFLRLLYSNPTTMLKRDPAAVRTENSRVVPPLTFDLYVLTWKSGNKSLQINRQINTCVFKSAWWRVSQATNYHLAPDLTGSGQFFYCRCRLCAIIESTIHPECCFVRKWSLTRNANVKTLSATLISGNTRQVLCPLSGPAWVWTVLSFSYCRKQEPSVFHEGC